MRAGAHYNASWEPYVGPLRGELARLRGAGDLLGGSLLIAQVSGGRWAQADVSRKRYVIDDRCQWCIQKNGTVFHRIWGCDGYKLIRRGHDHSGTGAAAMALTQPDILFTRAL
eukprot:1350880-Pyramimonas_sp.AAC.1